MIKHIYLSRNIVRVAIKKVSGVKIITRAADETTKGKESHGAPSQQSFP